VEKNTGEYAKLVLLRVPPRLSPIYLVVRATQYRPEEAVDSGDEYFYNQHTCPTNWIGDVEMVIADGSTDPHGVAQWVASIPAGDLLDDDDAAPGDRTKLETLGVDSLPNGWKMENPRAHVERVLALFGVKEGDE